MKNIIDGIEFPSELFSDLLNTFAEALAHTSLSCENAFLELEEYNDNLHKILNNDSETFYLSLPKEEQTKIKEKLQYFIVYSAYYQGILPGKMSQDQSKIKKDYENNFTLFDNYIFKTIVFQNKVFDERMTYKNVVELFRTLPKRNQCYKKCHTMKSNHINAFMYALNTEKITINSIQKINELINLNLDDAEIGFKKVDNVIQGANFRTMKKEYVVNELVKLLYEYDNSLPTVELEKLNKNDKAEYMKKICEREAKFHIEFERLHPFADGNGRTGRILLCRNLIKNGLAPVLITEIMAKQYKEYISNNDYKNFGQLILMSSSQELTRWISELRQYLKIEASELFYDNMNKL